MAKLLNPMMSGAAKGTINGVTFSGWHGLGIAKRKPTPARRLRTTQPANRARIGFLARNWGFLTEAQRILWRAWAVSHPQPDGFGGTFLMTGINAYCQLNVRAMMSQVLVAPIEDAPVVNLDVAMATLVAVDGAQDGAITLNFTESGTGVATDAFEVGVAGPFQSPGVFDAAGHYSVDSYVAGNLATAVLTGFVVDAWYWFRVRYVKEDGQASAYLYVQHQAPDVV